MITPAALLVPFRPRRALVTIGHHGPLWRSAAAVVLSGVITAALQLAGGRVEPSGRAAAPTTAIAVSLALPILLLVYWLGAAMLVDVAARLMGFGSSGARRAQLVLTGYTYPVLIATGVVTLAQSGLDRLTGSGDLALILGILNLAMLMWFIACTAMCARIAYDMPPVNAAVAALFPYATMSGLLMVLVIVGSILHAVGVG